MKIIYIYPSKQAAININKIIDVNSPPKAITSPNFGIKAINTAEVMTTIINIMNVISIDLMFFIGKLLSYKTVCSLQIKSF